MGTLKIILLKFISLLSEKNHSFRDTELVSYK